MLVEQIMRESEAIAETSQKIGAYIGLTFAQNTQDENAKALEAHAEGILTRLANKRLFFGIWWKNIDEKTAQKCLPKNKEYAYALSEMRKYKKYVLSEKEEQIINVKDLTGTNALTKLYDIITSEYTFPWKMRTKTKMLREEEIRAYVQSPRANERVQAYNLLWNKYGSENAKMGEIYRNIILDTWNENVDVRKFASPISVQNLSNDLSDEMVETFLNVCTQNTDIFQRYFKWKTKTLHLPFSRHHLYASFPHPEKKWSFEEGYSRVMEAYNAFSPRFKKEADRVLREKRMDVPLRKGKKSGAFCAGITPRETSFVMLNWTHRFQDVSTLAHELGHAVHSHLARKHSIFNAHAPLPLAETASTFGEMLLSQKMADENRGSLFEQYLLAHQLDDAYATIQRQAFFCLFEKEAFELVREGKTIPDINNAYFQNLRTQFGKKMQIPSNAQFEWGGIPHFFHAPFYVYAYAFGQLLVLALFERYQKEGKDFIPQYEKFLSYGGSKNPEKMLLEIGFDPAKKGSWQKGFDLLEKKMKRLTKT